MRRDLFKEQDVKDAVEKLLGFDLKDYQWKMVSILLGLEGESEKRDDLHIMLRDIKYDIPRIKAQLDYLDELIDRA